MNYLLLTYKWGSPSQMTSCSWRHGHEVYTCGFYCTVKMFVLPVSSFGEVLNSFEINWMPVIFLSHFSINCRYYLCLPCTVCEEQGLVTAAPCTERSDTRCSQDCIVPGCLFDVSRNTCVASVGFDLPVDPEVVGNDGRSVCHAPVTSEQPVVKNYKSMAPDKGKL